MRPLFLLAVLSLLSFAKVKSQNVAPRNHVVIFEDNGFRGINRAIPANWEANGVWSYFDEKISSIKVSKSSIVMLYEDEGFRGARKLISSDWDATGEDAVWNDEVSSIRIVDSEKPFTLVYQCFMNRNGRWEEMDNITLLSSGRMFLGLAEVTETSQGADQMSIVFEPHGSVLYAGNLRFTDNGLEGWLERPGMGKVAVYGEVNNAHFFNREPRAPRETLNELPRKAVAAEKERQVLVQQFGSTPLLRGYVTCFKGDGFSGESMILEDSWDGRGNSDWYDAIRSVRVSPGWAIRIYSTTDFRGSSRDLTHDWQASNDAEWYGEVGSIKVLRKAYTNTAGWHPGYITCFKGDRYNGESIILEDSWDGRGNSDWYDKIRSVRFASGWAIRVYSQTDFHGAFRDLTQSWSVADDPEWYGNVKSVKIIRKAQQVR